MENEVVAEFYLSKEEAMLTAGLFALLFGEEGSEAVEPFAAAEQQIACGEGIGEFLKPLGVTATQEGIGGLLKLDALFPQAMGQPMMLVETNAGRKREVGRDANEHSAPVAIVDVEVVLHDPALGQLQVPAIVLFVPDGGENACWFSCLQDDDQLVGLSTAKVKFNKLIATTLGSLQDGGTPLLGTILYPMVELISDLPQHIPAHWVLISISAEETHDPLGLLKRLDETVEQNAVKTAISESNAILVVLVESVHGELLCGQIPRA